MFNGKFCLLKYHVDWLREQCVLDCSSSIELSDITATSLQVNKDIFFRECTHFQV